MAMDNLPERVKDSIVNPNTHPWFPELTVELAAMTWDNLRRDTGLTPDTYGTGRILSRSLSAPRNIIASLQASNSLGREMPTIGIESLSSQFADPYCDKGVTFYSSDEIISTTILNCVGEAMAVLNLIPSLTSSITALVRSLHLLKTNDQEYDISFSEPNIPFSIFVSVPQTRKSFDALRVVEAIVHEAMHLQLTLIDKIFPLTISTSTTYFSPWKKTHRKADGVLQALYVFRVIEQFLSNLLLLPTELLPLPNYVRERRKEINLQIGKLQSFQYCADLTLIGSKFVQRLIRQDNLALQKWDELNHR